MSGVSRLNYFNGMSLNAADFELEQAYHMTLRRRLNRGLFRPGVVDGLEVSKTDSRNVAVGPGLALDAQGREIVLESTTMLAVPNRPPAQTSLGGYFLVIRYDEQKVAGSVDGCRRGSEAGDSRVVEAPSLGWTETWPDSSRCPGSRDPNDCAIVLAKVLVDSTTCAITAINPNVRQWAQVIVPGQVHAFALEGERDLDSSAPKVIRFHVRGGRPRAAILYLWGAQFTPYYYSELVSHQHGISSDDAGSVSGDAETPAHLHEMGQIDTDKRGSHGHQAHTIGNGDGLTKLFGAAGDETGPPWVVPDPGHRHTVAATTSGVVVMGTSHNHSFSGQAQAIGVTGASPRTGTAHTWLKGLAVKIDGVDITDDIFIPLGWKATNGTSIHPINHEGTGPIDLLALGLSIDQGEHSLEFSVASGGGRVVYNLYVE